MIIVGTIRRRLLVNALVDPDEVAALLPEGVRPHVTNEGSTAGTVVGCCLLQIDGIRPAHLPAVAGLQLRAAAHRISVEWEDGLGATTVGVFVPVRHTDSRLAVAVGGRWFPGVHERAAVDIAATADQLRWTTVPVGEPGRFSIRVEASVLPGVGESAPEAAVGGTCLGANIGLSPDHRGVLEGARMEPDHRLAREVAIEELESAFLASFSTAQAAPSYLMADVGVTWTPADSPRNADRKAST